MQGFFRKRWLMTVAAFAMAIVPTMAQAAIVVYNVNMSGPNEAPPNASPGIGSGTVTFNTDLVTMKIDVNFSGLTGNVTAAHIHAATAVAGVGTAGVATQTPSFTGFPAGAGVTSGSYLNTFDMTLASSYNAAYITANGGTVGSAFNALLTAAADGKAYFNIHSSAVPAGEIRGFLTAVPEPSSMLLTGLVLGAGVLYCHRSRKLKTEKA